MNPGRITLVVFLSLLVYSNVQGQNVTNYAQIPNPFLFLLREPAVHQDLQLSPKQRGELILLNEKYDGVLLAARNSPQKGQQRVAQVFAETRDAVKSLLTAEQQTRLRQIGYRLKGMPFVLLPDAAMEMELSDEQKQQIQQIVDETAKKLDDLNTGTYPGPDAYAKIQADSQRLQREQQKNISALLEDQQKQTIVALIGKPFDLASLGRVAFRAPEIAPGGTWINSEALNLTKLRGKVVALHFFAFG